MYDIVKRICDLFAAALGCIALAPFCLPLAVIIALETKGSPIFTQVRIGKDKSRFNLYKFRTMKTSAPKNIPTHLLKNPERYITKTGRFLRRFSLDELPQFYNIIKGEMSFVGPRPALWNQYDLLRMREPRANACVPGLTGLAQINGRDELPIRKKARYDNIYAAKKSAALDLYIIIKTFKTAATGNGLREGISTAGLGKTIKKRRL